MRGAGFSIKMLLGTIVAGIVYSVIGEVFYQSAVNVLPGVVLVMIYFTGLFLVLGITIYLLGKTIYSRAVGSINVKQWVITLVLVIALSAAFEFLYEIIREKKEIQEVNCYLFVLDDSGSMEQNDPNYIRYQAIDELLKSKPDDFRYGIYSFNDSSTLLRSIAPKSAGSSLQAPFVTGGTAIKGTLADIRDAMISGVISLDETCKIVLLSDGYATDMFWFGKTKLMKILDDFAKRDICISTVGLKNADESLMSLIAEKTGGVYVQVDDIRMLEEAMNQAAENNNDARNLIGYRTNSSMDFLLGIMRILFVAVLGVVTAIQKTVLCERFVDTQSVLISSLIGGILAGLCIELGMNVLGIHPVIMRVVTCILISFTLLKSDHYHNQGVDSGVKHTSGF